MKRSTGKNESIEKSVEKPVKKTIKKRTGWIVLAGTAMIAMTALLCFHPWNREENSGGTKLLYETAYPEFPAYPGEAKNWEDYDQYIQALVVWNEEIWSRWGLAEGCVGTVDELFTGTVQTFLSGSETENRIYSPVGVYTALASATEWATDEDRQQILKLAAAENLKEMQAQAEVLLSACYCDDGQALSRVNSESLRKEDSTLALDASFDFQAALDGYFDKREKGVFSSPDGGTECMYLSRKYSGYYYEGTGFQAVCLEMIMGPGVGHVDRLWIVLPDEGSSVDSVLASDAFSAMQNDVKDYDKNQKQVIYLTIPRFAVSGENDLEQGNINLRQTAELTFDERGCSMDGYAYITGNEDRSGIEVEVTIDRPFIFVLNGPADIPLLAGVVNQPGSGEISMNAAK